MLLDADDPADAPLTSPPSSRSLSVASSPSPPPAPAALPTVTADDDDVPPPPTTTTTTTTSSDPVPSPTPPPAVVVTPATNDDSPPPPSAPASKPPSTAPLPKPTTTSPDTTTTTTTTTAPAAPAPVVAPASKPAPKRRRRSPSLSPSPPPRPAPAPLRTIRLDVALGGPDNYEVNVRELATASGQRPATPPDPVRQYISESESSDDEGRAAAAAAAAAATTKPKRKKKTLSSEYYDVSDPFIDDSELALDQRTYFAQTKQQGFYVSSGEVALLKDRTASSSSGATANGKDGSGSGAAPKSGKGGKRGAHLPPPEPIAGPSNFPGAHQQHTMLGRPKVAPVSLATAHSAPTSVVIENGGGGGGGGSENGGAGTRDAPIAIVSDGDGDGDGDDAHTHALLPSSASQTAPHKRKGDATAHAQMQALKKRRKAVDVDAFHPELRAALQELRAAKERESWDVKGKFPPAIKPLLTAVALRAIRLNQYDDNFFNFMPELFPYNRFTMSKLIKRLVFQDHMTLLVKRQDEILVELKQLVDDAFPKIREDYDKAYQVWRQKMETLGLPSDSSALAHHQHNNAISSETSTPHPPPTSLPGTNTNGNASTGNGTGGEGNGDMDIQMYKPKDDAVPAPPQQRFKLSERMKGLIWNLVCLSNECCRIENEKSTLEGNSAQVSEQGLRKVLYQKIVAIFPDGWMNSGQISRDVSVIKKKLEKEVMDMEQ